MLPILESYMVVRHSGTRLATYSLQEERLPLIGRGVVRFEVITAVTMKNVVSWGIKTKFVLHRRHIMSQLQSPSG
jgi:hypothetical protein